MKGLDLYNAMAKAHAWDNGGASPEAPMNQYIINNNWKLATVNDNNLRVLLKMMKIQMMFLIEQLILIRIIICKQI